MFYLTLEKLLVEDDLLAIESLTPDRDGVGFSSTPSRLRSAIEDAWMRSASYPTAAQVMAGIQVLFVFVVTRFVVLGLPCNELMAAYCLPAPLKRMGLVVKLLLLEASPLAVNGGMIDFASCELTTGYDESVIISLYGVETATDRPSRCSFLLGLGGSKGSSPLSVPNSMQTEVGRAR